MRTRGKCILVIILLVLIAVSIPAFYAFREAQEAAIRSTLYSLREALQSVDATEFVTSPDVWQVLNDEDYRRIMDQLKNVPMDSPSEDRSSDGYLTDAWGNRFEISVKLNTTGRPEYRVWSRGRDGKSGTRDDIVIHRVDTLLRAPTKRG